MIFKFHKNQEDVRQCGRFRRATDCLNTTHFFDDVYERGTRGKKAQAEGQSRGRSMVEMLGVLAIIGVLSVGAIAGYQKAMFQYKMNQSLKDFNMIGSNLMTIMASQTQLTEFNSNLAIKIGIVPETMVNPKNQNITDKFGNRFSFRFGGFSATYVKRIGLVITLYSQEACVSYTSALKDMTNIDYLSFCKQGANASWLALCGDTCSKNYTSVSDTDLTRIQEICTESFLGSYVTLLIWFGGDWQTPRDE